MLRKVFVAVVDWFYRFLDRKGKIIEGTDPNRVTIANISAFFHLSPRAAKAILDQGVRNGKFESNEDGTWKVL